VHMVQVVAKAEVKRRKIRRQPLSVVQNARGVTVGTIVPAKAQASYADGFTIWFSRGLERLAMADLAGVDIKLLLTLVPQMAGRGWVPLKQEALAKDLGTSHSSISRQLGRLVDAGVLERQTKGSRHTGGTMFRIHEDFVWRGGAAAWRITSRERKIERGEINRRDEVPDEDGVLPD
jgi:CRP-like cAMP-binding protein